jgi:hypothetical protein
MNLHRARCCFCSSYPISDRQTCISAFLDHIDSIEEFCTDPDYSKYCDAGQIRALYVNETESNGPTTARYFASKLWGGETYFMQASSSLFSFFTEQTIFVLTFLFCRLMLICDSLPIGMFCMKKSSKPLLLFQRQSSVRTPLDFRRATRLTKVDRKARDFALVNSQQVMLSTKSSALIQETIVEERRSTRHRLLTLLLDFSLPAPSF